MAFDAEANQGVGAIRTELDQAALAAWLNPMFPATAVR